MLRILIAAFFLTNTVTVFAQATNIDSRGQYRCVDSKIQQFRRGRLTPLSLRAFNKIQDDAIKALNKKIRSTPRNRRARLQAQIAALRALKTQGRACTLGQLNPQTPTPTPTPTPLTIVRPLTVGNEFACAITPAPNGLVFCWGRGNNGQLGNGSFSDSSTPVQVSGISRAVAIAAGSTHTCAVVDSGAVYCWGDNFLGQFGTGNFSNNPSNVPVLVAGVTDAADIVSGSSHLCVRTNSGGMRCWGSNTYNQCGAGSIQSVGPIVTPTGLGSGITDIGAGISHSCAKRSNGAISCFGRNNESQLGAAASATLPVTDVIGADGVIAFGGNLHNCYFNSPAGEVFCVGRNNLGQLGISGITQSQVSYVRSTGVPAGVVQVASARDTTFFRTNQGTVLSVGANDLGQLGNAQTVSNATVAQTVGNLLPAASFIAASGNQACAIVQGGEVRCWGNNNRGQLGNGALNSIGEFTPVTVSGLNAAQ
jgi:alpha-tubulin suppressor-like RCC1 family protein